METTIDSQHDLYDFLSEAKGCIHVGASTGQEADIYAAHRIPVIWIEPIDAAYETLVERVKGFDDQTALKYLISDQDGETVKFNIANNGWSSSIFEFKDHKSIWPDVYYTDSVEMRTRTLASVIKYHDIDLNVFDALVIDVQGAEMNVLHGLGTLLERFKFIRVETADFEMYEGAGRLKHVDQFFALRGFKRHKTWRTDGKPEVGYQYEALYVRNTHREAKAEIKPMCIEDPLTGSKALWRIGAVSSVPRLGFQAHWGSIQEAFSQKPIPIVKYGGVWWEQGLTKGMNALIELGADYIITIDHDTICSHDDVMELLTMALRYPEGDVFAPWQVARGITDFSLVTMKDENGQMIRYAPAEGFAGDVTKVDMAAFGLTLIKTSALKRMPKPWFLNIPNNDGEWDSGKTDADSYFWRKASDYGLQVYVANRCRIGHLEEVVMWIDPHFKVIKQSIRDYAVKGRPFEIKASGLTREDEAVRNAA